MDNPEVRACVEGEIRANSEKLLKAPARSSKKSKSESRGGGVDVSAEDFTDED